MLRLASVEVAPNQRLAVMRASHFKVTEYVEHWACLDCMTGSAQILALQPGDGYRSGFTWLRKPQGYEVLAGHAFIRCTRDANVDLVLSQWVPPLGYDDIAETLAVARDLIFEHDERRATALLKEALPKTYGLFAAIVRRERSYLKERTRLAT